MATLAKKKGKWSIMQTPRLARCFQTKNEIKERNERRRTFIRRRKIQQNKRDWDKGQGKNQINERIISKIEWIHFNGTLGQA